MFLEPTEAWQLLSLCTALVAAFLLAVHFTELKTKVPLFYSWIGAIAIFGGALAFLLPIALNSGFGKDDDGRVLRQLILYTTGGVLGVITLGESHRKTNQEKEKNENDHTRQVYAERRSRYTKAIEHLADEKATVRLGGIYTLVGLVDEWLADDSLKPDEQQKEGQVIINNLCAYIRSPFPSAAKIEEYEARKELEELERKGSENLNTAGSLRLKVLQTRFNESDEYKNPEDITTDYTKLHEEQDVRRAIFIEMSKRSSTLARDKKGKVLGTFPGLWSDFDFDFSRAPIFYTLNGLTIEKANFSSAKFYSDAGLLQTMFIQDANFHRATFTQTAIFSGGVFAQNADFGGATFTQNAYFFMTTFTQDTDFSGAIFTQTTNFFRAIFMQNANFFRATFTQDTDFSGVTFTQDVVFHRATFTQTATFSGATFKCGAGFTEVTFTNFEPIFTVMGRHARFSMAANSLAYRFTVTMRSKHIRCGKAKLHGKPFDIPIGTVLFDPESWDEEKKEYTVVSEPAVPFNDIDLEATESSK